MGRSHARLAGRIKFSFYRPERGAGMALDWERMFRRYVADEVRTPYTTPVAKLTRTQANYEILFYAILSGVVFAVLGVLSLSGKMPDGNQPLVAMYAFALVWATLVFAWNKNQIAGTFSATGPAALLIYLAAFGFPATMATGDRVLLGIGIAAWAFYNWRIVRIAAAYPNMTDPPDAPKPRKRRAPVDYLK